MISDTQLTESHNQEFSALASTGPAANVLCDVNVDINMIHCMQQIYFLWRLTAVISFIIIQLTIEIKDWGMGRFP